MHALIALNTMRWCIYTSAAPTSRTDQLPPLVLLPDASTRKEKKNEERVSIRSDGKTAEMSSTVLSLWSKKLPHFSQRVRSTKKKMLLSAPPPPSFSSPFGAIIKVSRGYPTRISTHEGVRSGL